MTMVKGIATAANFLNGGLGLVKVDKFMPKQEETNIMGRTYTRGESDSPLFWCAREPFWTRQC